MDLERVKEKVRKMYPDLSKEQLNTVTLDKAGGNRIVEENGDGSIRMMNCGDDGLSFPYDVHKDGSITFVGTV